METQQPTKRVQKSLMIKPDLVKRLRTLALDIDRKSSEILEEVITEGLKIIEKRYAKSS